MNIIDKIKVKNQNILLLQGPMSPYFRKLGKQLKRNGANEVYKINFNFADVIFNLFSNKNISYKKHINEWEYFIEDFLKKHKIKKVFLYGNNRQYHWIAIQICKKLKIDVYVFEEGYFRPHYITLEKNGVNGNSDLMKLKINKIKKTEINKDLKDFPNSYKKMFFYASIYYLISNIFFFLFPKYKHHRPFNAFQEAIIGIKKYFITKRKEKEDNDFIDSLEENSVFFIPLQTSNDAQVRIHSNYENVYKFIEKILIDYKKSGSNDVLVFKHHPMDLGREDYYMFIQFLIRVHLLDYTKIILLDRGNLGNLLNKSKGVITINSTVGLSALIHNLPVKVLGKSFYDKNTITYQNTLIDFFKNPVVENYSKDNFLKFKRYIINNTQINDTFY